jgi:hypothetical protein
MCGSDVLGTVEIPAQDIVSGDLISGSFDLIGVQAWHCVGSGIQRREAHVLSVEERRLHEVVPRRARDGRVVNED